MLDAREVVWSHDTERIVFESGIECDTCINVDNGDAEFSIFPEALQIGAEDCIWEKKAAYLRAVAEKCLAAARALEDDAKSQTVAA